MQQGFTPADGGKRLREIAGAIANGEKESIVVIRLTPSGAASMKADLEAVAAAMESLTPATPPAAQPGQTG